MTLKEAKEYIIFSIKEGYIDGDYFEGMGEEELIEWAQYNADRGDYYANEREGWT